MSYMKEMKYQKEMQEFFKQEFDEEIAKLNLVIEQLKGELHALQQEHNK
jgi:hypothetical protein